MSEDQPEEKEQIIYSLVAKDSKPLSDYSEYIGTFNQACINFLKKIMPNSSAAVKLDTEYIIYYINNSGITFLIMTHPAYRKETAIGCLESIRKEFYSAYEGKDFEDISAFGLNSEFQPKLQAKLEYFNTNNNITSESLGKLKEELSKMRDEVVTASGLLNERRGKISVISKKAQELKGDSNTFFKNARKVRKSTCKNKVGLYFGIILTLLIIIYFIVCITCQSFTFQC